MYKSVTVRMTHAMTEWNQESEESVLLLLVIIKCTVPDPRGATRGDKDGHASRLLGQDPRHEKGVNHARVDALHRYGLLFSL